MKCDGRLPMNWRWLAMDATIPEPASYDCQLPTGHVGPCRSGRVEWVTQEDMTAVTVLEKP